MKRRKFLILGSILGFSSAIKAKEVSAFEITFQKLEPTLSAVQATSFP